MASRLLFNKHLYVHLIYFFIHLFLSTNHSFFVYLFLSYFNLFILVKVTRHICSKNSTNVKLLDVQACNSANRAAFQNPTKSLSAQWSIDLWSIRQKGYFMQFLKSDLYLEVRQNRTESEYKKFFVIHSTLSLLHPCSISDINKSLLTENLPHLSFHDALVLHYAGKCTCLLQIATGSRRSLHA